MAIRDKILANATHVLQPGEAVQAVIPAQTTSAWLALVSYWIVLLRNSYRVILATDRRILVCRSGRFRMTPVNDVLHELPRSSMIGPPTGLWYRCDHLGERLYINKRFHEDIVAADSAVGAYRSDELAPTANVGPRRCVTSGCVMYHVEVTTTTCSSCGTPTQRVSSSA